ncbi:hypothetical protein GCM10008922_27920 [Faecalicatena contorta]|uniref:hypothetical protein n=1 Tax=Faecalicatena contorta TaxID=39482 RepID=UPI002EA8656C|nr:hypothetical protein [Muricomes sp.]
MTFPKQIMTIPELMEMGFSRRELERYFRLPGQKYAWRKNPAANVRGHIRFDTELFEKHLEKEKNMQAKARQPRTSLVG